MIVSRNPCIINFGASLKFIHNENQYIIFVLDQSLPAAMFNEDACSERKIRANRLKF